MTIIISSLINFSHFAIKIQISLGLSFSHQSVFAIKIQISLRLEFKYLITLNKIVNQTQILTWKCSLKRECQNTQIRINMIGESFS